MTLEDVARMIADELAKAIPATDTTELPVTWTVKQTMEQTGLSRDFITGLIHRGDIEAFRIDPGNKRSKLLVIPASVFAWRDRQAAMQAPKKGPAVISSRAERQ